jgi:demethylmenaquinone methyltransferase / 2-methoxy-6-polyprenyl-1,4-benzoquinol methylase
MFAANTSRTRRTVDAMFRSIASRYDLANDLLSFGLHRQWRKTALAQLPRSDILVDLCTGTGEVLREASRQRLASAFIGIDSVTEMLTLAADKLRSSSNVSLLQASATEIPLVAASADIVCIAFGLRNVTETTTCLAEMRRILRPHGIAVVLEFGQPTLPLLSTLYRLYSRFVIPNIGALLTGNRRAYEYLPESSRHFPCGAKLVALLQSAGFVDVEVRALSGGIAYLYLARSLYTVQ